MYPKWWLQKDILKINAQSNFLLVDREIRIQLRLFFYSPITFSKAYSNCTIFLNLVENLFVTCVNPNVIGELKKSDGKIERRIREYSQHYIINIYVYIYMWNILLAKNTTTKLLKEVLANSIDSRIISNSWYITSFLCLFYFISFFF